MPKDLNISASASRLQGKHWRFIFTALVVVINEFRCRIEIQLKTIEKFWLGQNRVSTFGFEEGKLYSFFHLLPVKG